jgi:hypothetical protein
MSEALTVTVVDEEAIEVTFAEEEIVVEVVGEIGPAGPTGDVGPTGTSIMADAGAPDVDTGAPGDLYIDTTNGDLYRKD